MKKPVVGFLPLYVELYDIQYPEMRQKIQSFYDYVSMRISEYFDIIRSPICRINDEFRESIADFKRKNAIAIVTIHLDYSPSLESSDALAESDLPIIVLDTTPEYYFGAAQRASEIMYNHGIHGVQDMCNLFIRNNVRFLIEAGHIDHSDVLKRVASHVKAIQLAEAFRHSRVGAIGGPFKGMGDFVVSDDDLMKLGIHVVFYDEDLSAYDLMQVTQEEINNDYDYYSSYCVVKNIDKNSSLWIRSSKMGIVLRSWIKKENLSAFTFNFQRTGSSGLPVIPFHEINDLMSKGIGFAGEGDVLTAGFVGALLSVFPETTFSEMFCPNWAENSILLSHMGEMNVNVMAGKPLLIEKEFGFTSAENPCVTYGRFKPGNACIVDLAPFGNGKYSLIVSPVTILDIFQPDMLRMSIHGWFKPVNCDICRFLERYSSAGGTHHLAVVYGDVISILHDFANILGFEFVLI